MTQHPGARRFEDSAPISEQSSTALGVGLIFILAYDHLKRCTDDAERRHGRAERLAAYRRRHAWKASDVANLRTLNLSAVAERKLQRLKGKGRPVVRPHQDLAALVVEKLQCFATALSPEGTPCDRLRAIKQLPWWRHYVEALYRGEHSAARQRGEPGPAETAERLVGHRLGISASQVHHICGEIRRMRAACFEDANFPPLTLAKFDEWVGGGRSFDFDWDVPEQARRRA